MEKYKLGIINLILSIMLISVVLAAGCAGPGYVPNQDIWIFKVNTDGEEEWNITIDSGEDDAALSMIQVADGGYVIAGQIAQVMGGGETITPRIIKIDRNGIIVWDRTYPSGKQFGGGGYATSIVQTSDGGYAVSCHDTRILRLDKEGETVWETYVGEDINPYGEYTQSIIQTSDGGFVVVGGTRSRGPHYHGDAWVIKLDGNGVVSWNRAFGGNESDGAYTVLQISNGGGYAVGGYTDSRGEERDIWIIGLDTMGNMIWDRTLGSPWFDSFYSMQETSAGCLGIIYGKVTGKFIETEEVIIDNKGNVKEKRTLNASNPIIRTSDGGYIFAGFPICEGYINNIYCGTPNGPFNVHTVKLDGSGMVEWETSLDLNLCGGGAICIIQTSDGGYVVLGIAENPYDYTRDVVDQ